MRIHIAVLLLTTSVATAAQPDAITAYEEGCERLDYSPDGAFLATVPHKRGVPKVWDTATGELKCAGATKPTFYNSVAFSPDGKWFAAGKGSGVQMFDADTGKLRRVLTSSADGSVVDMAISSDGKQLAAVQKENNIVDVFNTDSGLRIITLMLPMEKPEAGTGGRGSVIFSPDGSDLVVACGGRGWPDYVGKESVIALFDTKTWKLRASFPASTHNVISLDISPDGELLAAACHQAKKVKIWEMPQRREVKDVAADDIAQWIKDLNDDDFGVRASADRKLRRIGPAAKEQLAKASESSSAEVAFRARRILDAMDDRDMKPLHVIQGPDGFHSVNFSPAGGVLATGTHGSGAANCTLWRLGRTLKRFDLPNRQNTFVVQFRPDGKQLAQGTRDGEILLHDVEEIISE